MPLSNVLDVDDTIVAIGTPSSPAVRGAVRISGPQSMHVARALGVQPTNERLAHQVDAEIDLGAPLGSLPVQALLWPTGRSYTGQPSMEIHTIGSLPILQAVVQQATRKGCRAARPGEFTLRAFLAGRLDLTQAEAVLGVIDAEGRQSLDHALRQLAGNLSQPIESLRSELLDLMADVEAGLDFVDEDIQFISDHDLVSRLLVVKDAVQSTQQQLTSRGRAVASWTVALRGLPNAGKSRLINALADQEVAIVADVAGTTRDVVAVSTTVGPYDVTLVDTAGIESVEGESAEQQIAQQAQRHAARAGSDAQIRLWCVDWQDSDRQAIVDRLTELAAEKRRSSIDLWVATKGDLLSATELHSLEQDQHWTVTSSQSGLGVDHLRGLIQQAIEKLDASSGNAVASTAARCGDSLAAAQVAIDTAIHLVRGQDGHEYVCSELRLAAAALGEVTGAVYNDDILDRVFSRFCIGK